ncbi:MAG: DNA repair protein RecO [Sphaerochaetaceae bacterium]|nr:DNA repair protein RecO [Sphaerochaetaceae bacterium]
MERDIRTDAVVTGTRHYGELHKAVTLLSPQLGSVNAVIFGGRKGKKSSLAPLFSFGTFQLYFNPVRQEYSLTEQECCFIPQTIMQDLNLTYTASYMSEAVTKISTDCPGAVYTLLCNALECLETLPEMRKKLIIDFTWKLLQISGIASDMLHCPSCDRRYADDEILGFSVSMTTPVCKECADSEFPVLPPGARRYLMYTLSKSFDDAFNVILSDTAVSRLSSFMLKWVDIFCQNSLKTLSSGLL